MPVPLLSSCELRPQVSERKLWSPAPGLDFDQLLSHHFQRMQTQLAMDLEKVANEREHQLHQQIATLHQENDHFRATLRLPPSVDNPTLRAKRLSSPMCPPSAWEKPSQRDRDNLGVLEARNFLRAADTLPDFPTQAPGRGAGRIGDSGLSEPARRQLLGGRNSLFSPTDLPTILRRLADEQELAMKCRPQTVEERQSFKHSLEEGRQLSARQFSARQLTGRQLAKEFSPEAWDPTVANQSVHIAIGDSNAASPAVDSETFDTKKSAVTVNSQQSEAQSLFVTVGSASHLEYKCFELWPIWLVENKSFADKINDRIGSGSNSNTQSKILRASGGSVTFSSTPGRCRAIHPTSLVGLGWNFLFCIVLCYELVVFPMRVFDLGDNMFLEVAGWLCVIFWTSDFILSFFLGYFTSMGTLELGILHTMRRYALSWMLPDLVVITIDWISVLKIGTGDDADNASLVRVGKILRSIRVLRVLRMLRLRKLREACIRFDEMINSQYFSIIKSIIVNMLTILVVSHFIGCLWYWIGCRDINGWNSWTDNEKHIEEWVYAYLLSLHWAITMFTPGGMHVQPKNVPERTYAIMVLVIGMILFSSIVSSITAATKSLGNVNAKYNGQVWRLRRLFREQKISLEVTTRVMRYSDFVIKPREHKVSLEECDLLRHLPQSLHNDVMHEIYFAKIGVHPFFEALNKKSQHVMKALCAHTVEDMYLATSDVLFAPGQQASSMYVLSKGKMKYEHVETSAIIDEKDMVRWFCEAVIWTFWVHQGSMVSLKECELIGIRVSGENGFHSVVSKHRADLKMPKTYGAFFVKSMNEEAGFNNDDPDDDKVLSDIFELPKEGIDYLNECINQVGPLGSVSEGIPNIQATGEVL